MRISIVSPVATISPLSRRTAVWHVSIPTVMSAVKPEEFLLCSLMLELVNLQIEHQALKKERQELESGNYFLIGLLMRLDRTLHHSIFLCGGQEFLGLDLHLR